jgi:D-lactate dehydrogenase
MVQRRRNYANQLELQYDQDCLEAANKDGFLSYTFIDPFLTELTVKLAEGHEAVCLFVNDICNRAVLEQLQKLGIVSF